VRDRQAGCDQDLGTKDFFPARHGGRGRAGVSLQKAQAALTRTPFLFFLAKRRKTLYYFYWKFNTVTRPATPELRPGQVLRTKALSAWSANPVRLAQRLVREGRLQKLGQGLFAVPRTGRFGKVPPDLQTVLAAFLEGAPFVLTGPPAWNSLGLGSTAMWVHSLVYNTKRTGDFIFGNQPVQFRRVRFPEQPTPEWFAVDLLESLSMAGLSLEDLRPRLVEALRGGRLDPGRLRAMAAEYSTATHRSFLEQAMREAK
jgi:hypothetical protein